MSLFRRLPTSFIQLVCGSRKLRRSAALHSRHVHPLALFLTTSDINRLFGSLITKGAGGGLVASFSLVIYCPVSHKPRPKARPIPTVLTYYNSFQFTDYLPIGFSAASASRFETRPAAAFLSAAGMVQLAFSLLFCISAFMPAPEILILTTAVSLRRIR